MAAINFPASPTVGQTFTAGGITWTWDGTKWTGNGLSGAYLPLAGGTMNGPLTLASNPVNPLDAATKQYADAGEGGANRIINGDMAIDQRNNGASGTAFGYTVDRWVYGGTPANKGTWVRNTNSPPPPGFPYSFFFQSTSAYTLAAGDCFILYQSIEADMVSDFAWGTPNAQPVTLSFWVQCTKTGTFSGAIQNFASDRSYPFTYSIPTANVWLKIIVTIPGDTTGTWPMAGNAGSVVPVFDMGSGTTLRGPANAWVNGSYYGVTGAQSIVTTNAANWLLTGVKLEIGSVATPFNRQSLAKSMTDCQRYYQKVGGVATYDFLIEGYQQAAYSMCATIGLSASMRSAPTITPVAMTSNNCTVSYYAGRQTFSVQCSATATGDVSHFNANANAYITLSAEL